MSSIILSQPQTSSSSSPDYGSFYDTTIQTIPFAYIGAQVQLNTTVLTNNIQISSGTQIVFNNAGKYNLEFSLQVTNLDSQEHQFYLWYDYLGTAVSNSASVITIPKQHGGGNGQHVAAWNFYIDVLNAGDNVELVWTSDSTLVTLETISPPAPSIPQIPSVIVTVSSL
jgi:hypothetical protein